VQMGCGEQFMHPARGVYGAIARLIRQTTLASPLCRILRRSVRSLATAEGFLEAIFQRGQSSCTARGEGGRVVIAWTIKPLRFPPSAELTALRCLTLCESALAARGAWHATARPSPSRVEFLGSLARRGLRGAGDLRRARGAEDRHRQKVLGATPACAGGWGSIILLAEPRRVSQNRLSEK
jgi:hypothetical protein